MGVRKDLDAVLQRPRESVPFFVNLLLAIFFGIVGQAPLAAMCGLFAGYFMHRLWGS
jgi:hypothetical protein